MSDIAYPTRRLKDLAVSERPQEKLQQHGPTALSDAELLALLLRSGSRGQNVVEVARQLLADAGSLPALTRWHEADFRRVKAIGPVKASKLLAVVELARRIAAKQDEARPPLTSPEEVRRHLGPALIGLSVEKFWVLCLDRKNRLLKQAELTSGTATSSLAHPREVFREALRHGATAIICAHNHPSGDPAPSSADLQVTRQLREASRAMDIMLTDHIILGQPNADPHGKGYYSFREGGLL